MNSGNRIGTKCNLCNSYNLQEAISIPRLPISKDYSGCDFRFTLRLHYCHNCGLLQICNPISPEKFYNSKFYLTGFHRPKHMDDLISCALHYKNPGKLIEVGCNDAAVLREIKSFGFTELAGIEPNHHAADLADGAGAIYRDYLTPDVANNIVQENGRYDFILCRHVIEHVSNLPDFFAGLDTLLSADGILIVELPNIELGFDAATPTILFEEHVNHFSETCLMETLRIFGFHPLEKRYYTFGGGSIAVICKKAPKTPLIPSLCKSKEFSYYRKYTERLAGLKKSVNDFIDENKDHEIVLYGAASRSAMFINVMEINNKIDHVFDDRVALHGWVMPGTNKLITPYAHNAKPTIALLGIGSENEWKVDKKFNKTLSLLPPRFNESIFSC